MCDPMTSSPQGGIGKTNVNSQGKFISRMGDNPSKYKLLLLLSSKEEPSIINLSQCDWLILLKDSNISRVKDSEE